MPNVPTTNLSAYYANTAAGNTIQSSVIDPALQDLAQAINDNYALFVALTTALELPIPDQSIVTRHLRNLAVTNPKLAALAVTADKLADGSITLTKLADLVVTAAKIANATITEPKYGTGSVSGRVIANSTLQTQHFDSSLFLPLSDIGIQSEFDKRGVNIQKFGAKGDGVTDDTQSFINAFTSGVSKLYIPAGIYIINIVPGTDHTSRGLCYEANVHNVTGIKGKSIIKLGSGNCDERVYRGFDYLFRYRQADVDVFWENVTFDYNVAQNPMYHYGARYQSHEVNANYTAITATVRDFTLKNCSFIGHSGSNCVVYQCNLDNTRDSFIEICENQFLDIGQESGIGVHDVSTLYVHSLWTNTYKMISNIHHNKFYAHEIGSPNAHNTYEGSSDVCYYHDNYCWGYWKSGFSVSRKENMIEENYNNICDSVCQGLGIWTYESPLPIDKFELLGFEKLHIFNNTYLLCPEIFSHKVWYQEYTPNGNGNYEHNSQAISFSALLRDINTLTIENNYVEYATSAAYDCLLSNAFTFTGVTPGTNTYRLKTPMVKYLNFLNNTVINAPHSVFYYFSFQNLTNLVLKGNKCYNPNCRINGSLIYSGYAFMISLTTVGYTNVNYVVKNDSFVFEDNEIRNIYTQAMLYFNIADKNGATVYLTYPTIKNNKFDIGASFVRPYIVIGLVANIHMNESYPSDTVTVKGLVTITNLANPKGKMSFTNGYWENGKWVLSVPSAATTTGITYKDNDVLINTTLVELGTTGSKYVIEKWTRFSSAWKETHILTGN